jgi:acyl carrier protein
MEKLIEILQDTLGISYSSLSKVNHFNELNEWDSLQYLRLVIGLQQGFSVEFSPEEIEQITSVDSIKSILLSKGLVI